MSLEAERVRMEKLAIRFDRLRSDPCEMQTVQLLDDAYQRAIRAGEHGSSSSGLQRRGDSISWLVDVDYIDSIRYTLPASTMSNGRRLSFTCPRLLACLRLYDALLLKDLLDDSLDDARMMAGCDRARGELHKMAAAACCLCNQLIVVCEKLQWREFSLLLERQRDRFAHNGAPAHVLALLQLPGLKLARARLLSQAGLDSIEKIAALNSPKLIYDIFKRHQEFREAKSKQQQQQQGQGKGRVEAQQRRAQQRNELNQRQAWQILQEAQNFMRKKNKNLVPPHASNASYALEI